MPDQRQMQDAIEQVRKDAIRTLIAAHLPEHQYLLAEQRIVAICLTSLRLLDDAWLAFHSYVNQPGRSPEHQAFIEETAGYFLIQQVQRQVSEIVSEAIRQVRKEAATPPKEPVRDRVIETVEVPPAFWKWLTDHFSLMVVIGVIVLFLLFLTAVC
jgi:hypothetical protein